VVDCTQPYRISLMAPNYPSIFNDVIGPVMRGPSSSHCAAAVRIGRLARELMAGRIEHGKHQDVVSMLIYWNFKQLPNNVDGCHQFRIFARPLNRPADRRTVDVQPAGHFASGDGQVLGGHIAD